MIEQTLNMMRTARVTTLAEAQELLVAALPATGPLLTWSPYTNPYLTTLLAARPDASNNTLVPRLFRALQDQIPKAKAEVPASFLKDPNLPDRLLTRSIETSGRLQEPLKDVVLAAAHPSFPAYDLPHVLGGFFTFQDGGLLEVAWDNAIGSPEYSPFNPHLLLPTILPSGLQFVDHTLIQDWDHGMESFLNLLKMAGVKELPHGPDDAMPGPRGTCFQGRYELILPLGIHGATVMRLHRTEPFYELSYFRGVQSATFAGIRQRIYFEHPRRIQSASLYRPFDQHPRILLISRTEVIDRRGYSPSPHEKTSQFLYLPDEVWEFTSPWFTEKDKPLHLDDFSIPFVAETIATAHRDRSPNLISMAMESRITISRGGSDTREEIPVDVEVEFEPPHPQDLPLAWRLTLYLPDGQSPQIQSIRVTPQNVEQVRAYLPI